VNEKYWKTNYRPDGSETAWPTRVSANSGGRMATISVREYVFFVFFQISKKHDFLRFFEITYQKVVKVISKSLVLNTSPRSDHFAQ